MRAIKFMAKHILYHITVVHAAVFKTQITTVVNYTDNIKRYVLNNLVIYT